MASKRIQKCEPRSLDLAIPCPACARFTLKRTYLPALGGMNGNVACQRCEYQDSYAQALAVAMNGVDPVPSEYHAPRKSLGGIQDTTLGDRSPIALLMQDTKNQLFATFRAVQRSFRGPQMNNAPRRMGRVHSHAG